MTNLKETLYFLDVNDDSIWTQDGSVRIDAVSKAFGQTVTREDIINADPQFNREKLKGVLSEEQLDKNPGDEEVTSSLDEPCEQSDDSQDNPEEQDNINQGSQELEIYSKKPSVAFIKSLADLGEDDIQRQKDTLQGAIKTLESEEKAVAQSIYNAKLHLLAVTKAMNVKFPNSTETEAIQAYIKAQNVARAERAKKKSLILENFDVSDIDSRSPIDRAMARRNSRGSARPGKV